MRRLPGLLLLIILLAGAADAWAQRVDLAPRPLRGVYLDDEGVVRWEDTREEVRLFGANYALPTASDYRAAGYLTDDRKRLIDEDLAHFARMGWDGLRVAFWGDYQASDRAGNLLENDHLDVMNYLIARARERGIYILFNPIHAHNAGWPDALRDSMPGFGYHFPRSELGVREEAIAAQVNYLTQLLNHVNPYTGTALKDEPAILFIEMINEPHHHPEDLEGSVRYIDALAGAVRSTGADKILFHNISQDFRIGDAIRRSSVPGISFGWYPTGLNAGRTLRGNHLRTVDDYPDMRRPELDGMPRIVYEFDAADDLSAYMYPAMARTYRSVGTQFAAMFAYDMLATASRNLGWQTHHLNLVYTPSKAMSGIIAAEAMRRLPRMQGYGEYPANTRFGDFRVSHEENLSEMVTAEAFLHAGSTRTAPTSPGRLERIAGYGSSPVVSYPGEGVYFLDRIRPGVWRLEVYPDAVPIDDPFRMQSPDKIVTRAIHRVWPMTIDLPDLGPAFWVEPVASGNAAALRAEGGRFTVTPGLYVLGARGPVDRSTLPTHLGNLRFDEYHAPPPDPLPLHVEPDAAPQYLAGRPLRIRTRIFDAAPAAAVTLSVRPAGAGRLRPYPMQPAGGYDYQVILPEDAFGEGLYEYAITVEYGDSVTTFPERLHKRPTDWDFYGTSFWRFMVVPPDAPLRLLAPAEDVARLAYTRTTGRYRRPVTRVVPSTGSGEPALHLELPLPDGRDAEDSSVSLYIGERIAARGEEISRARRLRLRVRGLGKLQVLHVTLVEQDGTSWSAAVPVDASWSELSVPLTEFRAARGVMLPAGYPGSWNYWMGPALSRGGTADAIRLDRVERLQFSLRPEGQLIPDSGSYGVQIESAALVCR